jgi:hypothetical protein
MPRGTRGDRQHSIGKGGRQDKKDTWSFAVSGYLEDDVPDLAEGSKKVVQLWMYQKVGAQSTSFLRDDVRAFGGTSTLFGSTPEWYDR